MQPKKKIYNQKRKFIFYLVILLLANMSFSCLPTKDVELEPPSDISFRTVGSIPVIEAKLNGRKAYFIVDTGASISILNEELADHYGFKVLFENKTVSGVGGFANYNTTYNCSIEMGNLKLKHVNFKSTDLSHLSNRIHNDEMIRIAGIIGSDVFVRYKIYINYRDRTISY